MLGITGYCVIEGWNFLDSAYMVVITLFTIGFEEVHPLSHGGQIFTMLIAVAGVGTAVYAGGRAVEIIVEGEMSGYQKRKRMDQIIREMNQHYIICGYGRVGHQVAETFEASKICFVVIDSKLEITTELGPQGIPYILGDATSDDVLMKAGIKNAKGLVACSDSDVVNVYVTLSARALNPGLRIVGRAAFRDTEKKPSAAYGAASSAITAAKCFQCSRKKFHIRFRSISASICLRILPQILSARKSPNFRAIISKA
jgi:voltage-gated potassium channel